MGSFLCSWLASALCIFQAKEQRKSQFPLEVSDISQGSACHMLRPLFPYQSSLVSVTLCLSRHESRREGMIQTAKPQSQVNVFSYNSITTHLLFFGFQSFKLKITVQFTQQCQLLAEKNTYPKSFFLVSGGRRISLLCGEFGLLVITLWPRQKNSPQGD